MICEKCKEALGSLIFLDHEFQKDGETMSLHHHQNFESLKASSDTMCSVCYHVYHKGRYMMSYPVPACLSTRVTFGNQPLAGMRFSVEIVHDNEVMVKSDYRVMLEYSFKSTTPSLRKFGVNGSVCLIRQLRSSEFPK
jgi:hypothetical protein